MTTPEKATPGVVGRADADQTQLADLIVPASQAADKGPLLQLVLPPPRDWVTRVRTYEPPEFVATGNIPPVEWCVDGWIQRGLAGVLVAGGGTGKTTLMLLIAVCHATGRPFMGRAVRRGKAVILSNDDTQANLDAALALVVRACALSETEMLLVRMKVTVVSLLGLDGPKAFTANVKGEVVETDLLYSLQDATAEMNDLVCLVLDTARQFAGGPTNDEQVMKLLIGGATEFAATRQCYVVVPHHTGKANYRDATRDMYSASGSAAISDNSRFVLLLMAVTWGEISDRVQRTGNEDGDPMVLMSTRGSLRVKAPPPIYMIRNDYDIRPISGSLMTKDQQADKRDCEILQAVRKGAQTKQAIEAVVRGRATDTRQRVGDLLQRGHLIYSEPSESGRQTRPRLIVSASGGRLLDDANRRDDSPGEIVSSPLDTGRRDDYCHD